MSFLVIVTFDLHGASPESYLKVKKKLSRLNLEKQITSKTSGRLRRLPANTFVAKYDNSNNASSLRSRLRLRVKRIIVSEGLEGDVFVAVGDSWAWGTGRV
ncbi:hypothetical protein ACFLUU_07955 [Chloroflexota bacterium]